MGMSKTYHTHELKWVVGVDPGICLPALAIVAWPHGEIVMFDLFQEEDAVRGETMFRRSQEVGERVGDSVARYVASTSKNDGGMSIGIAAFVEDAAFNAKFQSESTAMSRQSVYEKLRRTIVIVEPVGIQQAKKAMTGNGSAHKDQMVKMFEVLARGAVREKFKKLSSKEKKQAVADAAGVALGGLRLLKEARVG